MQAAHDDALEHFLEQYCVQPASPHYAVLIEGDWGSGKTWRIKEFAKKFTEIHKKKTLYVSLYGVNNINDIAEQFYRQLNPLLGHELVQASWALARKALKGTLKIADEQVEVELSAPDMQKRLGTENAILIFDDLERSTMALEDVLGIINQLVEHDDHRVLILANAARVPTTPAGVPFVTLKEKVIGRTLRVSANPRAALQAFLTQLGDLPGSQQLEKYKETVLRVFERANYHNLRQLRQALLDFAQIRGALQQARREVNEVRETLNQAQIKLQSPDAFDHRLVYEVLALSIEYRAGQLTLGELDVLCNSAAKLPTPEAILATGHGGARLRVHGLDDILAYALPPALYREFFRYGEISPAALRQAIEHSAWLAPENQAIWLQLWHWHKLRNEQFAALRVNLHDAYKNGAFNTPGEFLHATGLLLQFIQMGQLSIAEDALETLGEQIIKGKWGTSGTPRAALTVQDRAAIDSDSAYGLAYWSCEHSSFRKLQSDLRIAVTATDQLEYKHWWELWMAELRNDPEAWASRITPRLGAPAKLADLPFTQYLHVDKFAKFLVESDMPTLHTVTRALQQRYASARNPELSGEIKFWNALLQKLEYFRDSWDETDDETLAQSYLIRQLMPFIAALPETLEALSNAD